LIGGLAVYDMPLDFGSDLLKLAQDNDGITGYLLPPLRMFHLLQLQPL